MLGVGFFWKKGGGPGIWKGGGTSKYIIATVDTARKSRGVQSDCFLVINLMASTMYSTSNASLIKRRSAQVDPVLYAKTNSS